MQATEVITHLQRMGITLHPLPGGRLRAKPRRALTNEARELILSHKVELVGLLHTAVDNDSKDEPTVSVFYEQLLGNTARSVATLTTEDRNEACLLGLIPASVAYDGKTELVAYRAGESQTLIAIPADRYDGLALLEAIARGS